jgi:peroxiredoxin
MGRTGRLLSRAFMACGLIATSGIGTNATMIADELKVGDQAPDFTLPGSDGKTYTLSQLHGKTVVLAWFPKAFTGG